MNHHTLGGKARAPVQAISLDVTRAVESVTLFKSGFYHGADYCSVSSLMGHDGK